MGNIVSSNRTENTGTNVRYNTSYEYDKYGQLIRENNERFNKTYLYYYDNYGNIIYKAELPYTTENLDYDVYNNKAQTMYCGEVFGGEYVAESHDDFISIQGVIPTCYEYDEKQRLVLSGDKAIGNYDAFGNPHLYNGKVLQWNGARLKKFGDWEFTYDSRGYRKQKLNGTELTEFLYDEGGKLLQERKPIKGRTCIITYLYEGDEVVGFTVPIITTSTLTLYEVTKQMPFYYIKDVLGNITEIVDSNGAVVVKYYYDAYGRIIKTLDTSGINLSSINPFRYRSYYQDNETGWYYLNSRYYNPLTNRFITMDAIEYLNSKETIFRTNLYLYCENNPVNNIDDTGYYSKKVLFERSWLFELANIFGINISDDSLSKTIKKRIFAINVYLIKLELSISVGLAINYKAGISFNYTKSSIGVSTNVGLGKGYSICYAYTLKWNKIIRSMSIVYCATDIGLFASLNFLIASSSDLKSMQH